MLAKFLPKSEFNKNVLTLLTGSIIGQVIPVLISPLLTRIYKPEDFGILAIYMSLSSIFSLIATGRYELAIVLPEDDGEAATITLSSIIILTIFSSFVFLVLLVHFYFSERTEIARLSLFIAPLIFLTSLYQTFTYWLNRKKRYKLIAQNRVIQACVTVLVSIVLGLTSDSLMNSKGMLFGQIYGLVVAIVFFAIQIIQKDKSHFTYPNFSVALSTLKKYSEFPRINLLSSLFNTTSTQAPTFVLSYFFNASIVGYHSLSNRVLNLPMTVLGNNIAQVYYQRTSELKQKGEMDELKNSTLSLYKQLLKIGSLPISLMLFFGKDLFALIFGAQWGNSGTYAQLQSLWFLFVFVSSPLSSLLTILNKHKQSLWMNFALLISRIGVLLIGGAYFKDPFVTFFLYGVIGALIWILFTYYLLSLVNINHKEATSFTMLGLLPGFCASGALFMIYKFIMNYY